MRLIPEDKRFLASWGSYVAQQAFWSLFTHNRLVHRPLGYRLGGISGMANLVWVLVAPLCATPRLRDIPPSHCVFTLASCLLRPRGVRLCLAEVRRLFQSLRLFRIVLAAQPPDLLPTTHQTAWPFIETRVDCALLLLVLPLLPPLS